MRYDVVPDKGITPSSGGNTELKLVGQTMEEDLYDQSATRVDTTPGHPTVDGGKKVGTGRTGMKKRSGLNRLDSSLQTKTRTITDYYSPRAPSKRKRMMNGVETVWEEVEGWDEEALSYLERSGCDTPSRVGCPTTHGDVRTHEGGPVWEEDGEWTTEALSYLERSECNTPTRGDWLTTSDVGHKWRGQRDSSDEERCVEPQLSKDEQDTLSDVQGVLSDDGARGVTVEEEQMGVDSLTTDVGGLSISTSAEQAALVSNVRGPHVDMTETGDDQSRVEQEVTDDIGANISSTPLSQHPSMVEGGEDEGCTYTDGVCALHGPATKKWRGGKTWGKKKNGLFGWKYAREIYWKCERRPSGPVDVTEPVGGPEPTFIYLGVSRGAKNLSNRTTTGGRGVERVERFRDFGMSSQPARDSRK